MSSPTNPYDPPVAWQPSTGLDEPASDLRTPVTDPAPTSRPATPESSTADKAKEEAAAVKDSALDAGRDVAGSAKQEAANVANEASAQAKNLFGELTEQARGQAGAQQQRAAGAVHSLAAELGGMASASDQSGPLTDLVHQASRKGGELGHWLESREPADVLAEVRRFARRRPGTFLLLCGAAGVIAGRLTRSAVATHTELDSPRGSGRPSADDSPVRRAETTPALPVTALAEPAPTRAPASLLEEDTVDGPGAAPTGPGYLAPALTDPLAGTDPQDPRR